LRLKSAEAVLRGKSFDGRLAKQAGEAAAEEADVVADVHGSVAYKKQLVRIHVVRALQAAWQDGTAQP
jgi:carbon-monoxide dehydrogenase medium subunit